MIPVTWRRTDPPALPIEARYCTLALFGGLTEKKPMTEPAALSAPMSRAASVRKRVLVAYSASSTHAATTRDYLESLSRYMDAEVRFVHATHGAVMDFHIAEFDAVFHSYCARLPYPGYLSDSYLAALKSFKGPKVAALQDEYERTNDLKAAIKDLGFDAVLTCMPPDLAARIYPPEEFPGVEFVRVLSGYVPENAAELARFAAPLRDRKIIVGYRGRDLGARYGTLGFDKAEIGRRMRAACDARGIECDISSDEGSRIYGDEWWAFLGSCRATLGAESGSDLFDYDGSIERKFKELSEELGRKPTHEEFFPLVRDLETGIGMGQISPRVFEAAALKTPLILLRGRYSEVVRAEEHYIPLERDYSNIDHVLDRVANLDALEAMAERTWRHLIGSGAFAFRGFAKQVDALVDRILLHKGGARPSLCAGRKSDTSVIAPADDAALAERPTAAPMNSDRLFLKLAQIEIGKSHAEIKRLHHSYGAHIKWQDGLISELKSDLTAARRSLPARAFVRLRKFLRL